MKRMTKHEDILSAENEYFVILASSTFRHSSLAIRHWTVNYWEEPWL